MSCKPCCPRPEINAVTITFRVLDNDGRPICGAVFRLECDCECGLYMHALSNKNGCVSFCNVCPGTYSLTQIATAYGYEFDDEEDPLVVIVTRSGNIRIGDYALGCFTVFNLRNPEESNCPVAPDAPEIDDVEAGDVTVSGTGEPCCKVEVTFPRCNKCCATSVNRDGTWRVDVPCGITLEDGNVITAELCCDCRPRSEATQITVGGEDAEDPDDPDEPIVP